MDTVTLARNIEALLFYKGEPMKRVALAKALGVAEEALDEPLAALAEGLATRGIRLLREGEYVALLTAPECAPLLEALRKEELEGPLGKAGLETLAIVIYHGPLSKVDIEYIRGVNSSSTLRSLLMRGLIEKVDNPNDKRSFLYRPTPELPAHLGLTSSSEAPRYEEIKSEIAKVLETRDAEEKAGTPAEAEAETYASHDQQ
jgi:segregation and condensation protein B